MYKLIQEVLRGNNQQTQQMVREMYGVGGQRGLVDQNNDGQISF